MSNYDIRIQLDLKIPMRDGVRLYGALYRPTTGDKFPVLLIQISLQYATPALCGLGGALCTKRLRSGDAGFPWPLRFGGGVATLR